MATEIAQAYVQIIPSAQGISGKLSQALSGSVSSAGKSAGLGLGKAMIGAFAALGVGKALGNVISTGMDFDQSISQVAATMGKSVSEMMEDVQTVGNFTGNLRDYALEMGRTTQFSAQQSADALNYMALAGYDTVTSMQMLPNVMNLAAAGGFDLARASDMVTDTQTAFGISLERTSLMVAEMAKAASTGNTSVEQLGDAFLTVGGLAQELNGGFVTLENGSIAATDGVQELEIAMVAMANAGIKGSEAGTHMRNMLLKLADPTSDGAKQLERLGVDVFDVEGRMRSLGDIFGELSTELSNLTQEEKIKAISSLFNTRDLASAEAILNSLSEELVKVGDDIYTLDEAYAQFGDDIYDSSKGFEIIRNDWNTIGEAILNAWLDLDTFNDGLANIGIGSVEDLQSSFEALGVSAEDFQAILLESGGDADKFTESLWEAADAGTEWSDVLEAIGGSVDDLQEAFDNSADAAERMAATQMDNLAGDITLFKSALEGAKITLSDGLAPALRMFVGGGTEMLSKFTELVKENGLSGALQEMLIGIPSMISEALQKATTFIREKGPEIAQSGTELAKNLLVGLVTSIPEIFSSTIDLVGAIGEAMSTVDWMGLATEIIETFRASVAEMAGILFGSGDDMGIIDGIWSAITENTPKLLSNGVEIISNIATGIMNSIPGLVSAAGEIVTNLVGFLLENLPGLLEAGVQLLGSLAQGFIDNLPELISSAASAIVGLLAEIASHLPELLAKGGELLGEVASGIIHAIPDLVAKIPQVIMGIVNAIGEYDWLSLGGNIIKGIGEGILAFGSSLITSILDVCGNAFDAVKSFFGIKSPSKLMADEIGHWIPPGIALGIEDNMKPLTNTMRSLSDIATASYEQNQLKTQTSSDSAKMDLIIALLMQYLPECAKEVNVDGDSIMESMNRQLGLSYGVA